MVDKMSIIQLVKLLIFTLLLKGFRQTLINEFKATIYVSFQKPTKESGIDYHDLRIRYSKTDQEITNYIVYTKNNIDFTKKDDTIPTKNKLRFLLKNDGGHSKNYVAYDMIIQCESDQIITVDFKIKFFNCYSDAQIFYNSLKSENNLIVKKVLYDGQTMISTNETLNEIKTVFHNFISGSDATALSNYCTSLTMTMEVPTD